MVLSYFECRSIRRQIIPDQIGNPSLGKKQIFSKISIDIKQVLFYKRGCDQNDRRGRKMLISSIQSVEKAPVAPPVSANGAGIEASAVYKPYYYSPELAIDPKTRSVVLQIRDAKTGKVTAQYPTERDLQAYSQHQGKTTNAGTQSTDLVSPTSQATAATVTKAQSQFASGSVNSKAAPGATASVIV